MSRMKRLPIKMPNKYRTKKDVVDRLSGCVFLFDGTPRYFESGSYSTIHVFDIERTKLIEESVKPDDPRIDISSIELGYMNVEDTVFYLSRDPAKRYQQGLNTSNVQAFNIDGQLASELYKYRDGVRKYLLMTQEFVQSVTDDFPSYVDGLSSLLSKSRKEVAISQELAMDKSNLDLVYFTHRTKVIGYMEDEGIVKIPNRRTAWVAQTILERNGVPCLIKSGFKLPELRNVA